MPKASGHWLCAIALTFSGTAFAEIPNFAGMREATQAADLSIDRPETIEQRSYYPDGTLKEVTSVVIRAGKPPVAHGPSSIYHPNGQLQAKGTMVLGKRHGRWQLIDGDGQISEGSYENGKRSGEWRSTDGSGKLVELANYVKDELHGPLERHNEFGYKILQQFYIQGELQGEQQTWHPNGELASVSHWVLGQRNGPHKRWLPNGTLWEQGSYRMGIPTGRWSWHDRSGKLLERTDMGEGSGVFYEFEAMGMDVVRVAERPYSNGEVEGLERSYYPDGVLKSQCDYISGLRHGSYTAWHSNGVKAEEGLYEDHEPVGTWRAYHNIKADKPVLARETRYQSAGKARVIEYAADGSTMLVREVDDGENHGRETHFYANGTVRREGNNEHGKPHGLWKEFYISGQMKSAMEYVYGEPHGAYEEWHAVPEGQDPALKLKGSYVFGEREGEWTSYFEDGGVATRVNFENGRETGEFLAYWPSSGQLRAKGVYVQGRRHGKWLNYYQNGSLASKEAWVYGERHGVFGHFHMSQDGNPPPKARGQFDKGVASGLWQTFYPNGTVETAQYYKRGELHGDVVRNFENGQPRARLRYDHGVLHGPARRFFEDGSLASEGAYVVGLKQGKFKYYHPGSETLASVGEYHRGQAVGSWEWFATDGQSVLDRRTLRHGTGEMLHFHANGQLARQASFVEGMRHGPRRQWYENGQLMSEALFNNGVLHGEVTEYHQSGQTSSRSEWAYGRREGDFESWHPNGQRHIIAAYKNDLLQGEAREWHEDGNLRSIGMWNEGVRDGTWKWYDESGRVSFELTYDAGILMSSHTPQVEGEGTAAAD